MLSIPVEWHSINNVQSVCFCFLHAGVLKAGAAGALGMGRGPLEIQGRVRVQVGLSSRRTVSTGARSGRVGRYLKLIQLPQHWPAIGGMKSPPRPRGGRSSQPLSVDSLAHDPPAAA